MAHMELTEGEVIHPYEDGLMTPVVNMAHIKYTYVHIYIYIYTYIHIHISYNHIYIYTRAPDKITTRNGNGQSGWSPIGSESL